ncbi:uncharacterized protein [Nicotiana tomentosiformis]|uniref:uncharacterized protein n=1 Tax=Nicotiana tomentosiformis TaxID=4098 RepID=UPI00388C8946
MIVTQYETRFVDLARHATILIPTDGEKVRRFIDGLTFNIRLQMAKETGDDNSFQRAVEIVRRIEIVRGQDRGATSEKRPRYFGGFSGASSRGRVVFGKGYPPRPIHLVLHVAHGASGGRGSYGYCSKQSAFSAPLAPISAPPIQSYQGGYPSRQGRFQGQQSQQLRPARGEGQVARGEVQAVRSEGQAIRGGGQLARGRLRGGGQNGRAQPRFYAFSARLEEESSDAIITSIVPVCHRDASVLFYLGSTYSYVSSYFASYLIMPRDSLNAPVYMSTLVGDSIVVYHVSCVVSIGSLETSVDLLLLDMIDFDVILGMDWLSPYHAILGCHAKTVTLAMPGLPQFEGGGLLAILPAGLFLMWRLSVWSRRNV